MTQLAVKRKKEKKEKERRTQREKAREGGCDVWVRSDDPAEKRQGLQRKRTNPTKMRGESGLDPIPIGLNLISKIGMDDKRGINGSGDQKYGLH